jgi:hypothetical protein
VRPILTPIHDPPSPSSFTRICPLLSPPRRRHALPIQKLSLAVENSGGADQFFTTFQKGGFLDVPEIQAGTQLPQSDIAGLVALYGGPFTRNQWVRLISSRLPEDLPRLRSSIEADVVLTRLAERTRGTNWEELANASTTADEFVQVFRTLKLHCDTDIRQLYESEGKDAFIAAIKVRADRLAL